MGKQRRQDRARRRRDQRTPGADAPQARPSRPSTRARAKSPWRRRVDAWGGLPVVGSILGAIVLVVVLIWVNRPSPAVNDVPYEPVARTQVDGRVEGDPNAPVTIIEFSDFQCPFCKRFADETAPTIVSEFVETGIASIEYRHFAFLGDESRRAAEATECAADQNLFWAFHDILFLRQGDENVGVFSDANLKRYAGEIADAHEDFDLDAFNACFDSGEKRGAVEAMTQQASDMGIRSTPTFLVNGAVLNGAQPIEVFRDAIRAAQGGQ